MYIANFVTPRRDVVLVHAGEQCTHCRSLTTRKRRWSG